MRTTIQVSKETHRLIRQKYNLFNARSSKELSFYEFMDMMIKRAIEIPISELKETE